MSDAKKVEPAKAVTVDEVKKQLDNLSAYVRKIVKRLEELGGIDINMDGKIGLILVGLMLLSGVMFAADTLITGFNAETGVGTFKVVSDGTSATLTVDKLVVSTGLTAPSGVTGTSTLATNLTYTLATNTIIYLDASTNVATNTSIRVSTVTIQTAPMKFVSGICTNKP